MPYIFTNTVTTLPFGYWVKLELIKSPGTGSDTLTNGGYIMSIGPIPQSVDLIPGAIKPGQVTVALTNRAGLAGTKLFTSTIDAIECRIWLSYDAGTTWECIFGGFVSLRSIGRRDVSTTVTENQVFQFNAEDYLLSLKGVDVDFGTYGITGYINCPSHAPIYSTDETGAPFLIDTSNPSSGRTGATRVLNRPTAYFNTKLFVTMPTLLTYIIDRIPFTAGATAPASAIDYSDLEHRFYNANTAADYPFADLSMWYWPDSSWAHAMSFFGPGGGPGGAYDAKNLQELLSRLSHSLTIVPVPRLWNNGGTLTYTVRFVHRISTSTPSVGVTLAPLMSRAFEPAPWMDGVSVETIGLPVKRQLAGIYGGSAFNQRNYWYTSPNHAPASDPYVWWQAYVDPQNNEQLVQNAYAGTGQLFVKTGSTSVRNVHKAKILASQAFHEAAGIGWYGMQDALFDLVAGNSGTNLYAGLKSGYQLEYATLRGTDVWDLRLLKKLPVAGDDYVIESIERSVMQNRTRMKVVRLTA